MVLEASVRDCEFRIVSGNLTRREFLVKIGAFSNTSPMLFAVNGILIDLLFEQHSDG
jgi:hypothetical protein